MASLKKPNFGLAAKFSLMISMPVLVASLVLSQSFIRHNLDQIRTTMIERGKSVTRGISRSSEYGLLIESEDLLKEVIDKYIDEEDMVYIHIKGAGSDNILAGYCAADWSAAKTLVAEHTEANDIMDESDCQVSETDVLFDFVNHVVIVREKKSREDVGLLAADNISLLTQNGPERIGTIQVGLSKAGMMSSMRAAKLRAIWLAAAVIFLAIMATYIIVKLMFRPINRLAVAAGKVSRGDFDSKVIVRSRDEIGDLAESFNTMTGDLKKSNDSLQYRLQLEKLITSISAKFINLAIDEIDQEIENALHSIGEFIGTEGNYVFIFSRDGSGIEEIYKWCAESTDLKLDRFKEFPAEDFSWWIKQISKLETINIPNVSELTPEAGTAKESLLEQGIRSLVITPMVYGGALVGSLIFASVKEEKAWLEQDIVILKMVGGIFVNALKRKQTEEALQHRLEVEEQMTKELEEKTEELSRSNGELNSFVYTVSHDLKAPVVTLQGFSSILLSDYGDQLDDSGRMYIERIQKNSERMGMLINDLLELSRIGRVL